MNTVGKNIRALRQKAGLSQDKVAQGLNISIPAFSKIETGITDLNMSRLQQIANLFEVSPAAIIFEPGAAPADDCKDLIQELKQKLTERDKEIIQLQKKVIDLYEALGK